MKAPSIYVVVTALVVAASRERGLEVNALEQQRRRALAEQTSCEWRRKATCHGSPTYNIVLHWVDHTPVDGNDKNVSSAMDNSIPFPQDLKAPVQAAAELWSRAIVGRKAPTSSSLRFLKKARKARRSLRRKLGLETRSVETACGSSFFRESNTTVKNQLDYEDTIILCVHYEPMDQPTLGRAQRIVEKNGVPIVAKIILNSRHSYLDYCDWTNIAAHEMAHALGFTLLRFVVGSGGNYKTFLGRHTKREWDKLGDPTDSTTASSARPQYPPLEPDGSHWSELCFQDGHEMMLPGYSRIDQHESDGRIPLSRLTLAALEDVGYHVNYDCADDDAEILPTCTVDNHPSTMRHLVSTLQRRWKRRHRKFRIFYRSNVKRRVKRLLRKFRIFKRKVRRSLAQLIPRQMTEEEFERYTQGRKKRGKKRRKILPGIEVEIG